jgi:hypothetical protein
MKHKETTTTTLVLEALRNTDDFMSYVMLAKATGRSINQVSAACFFMRQHRAVDAIIGADGMGWWFALPPESDTRHGVLVERTPEAKPRRRRRVAPKPPTA